MISITFFHSRKESVLKIKKNAMRYITWLQGVARLAAVCLSISYPTLASAPHSVINGFKNLLAIAAATDVSFKEAHTIKEFLKVRISLILLFQNK
jgi:large subunit ribosomal protein LP0